MKRMNDGDRVTERHSVYGPCPVHDTPVRKVYTFGRYRDAEVAVFKGCRCAVAQQMDPVGIECYAPAYFTSYRAATGLAEMAKAVHAAKYA